MQIVRQSFSYHEKRSVNYQSVEAGLTTEYTLDPTDTAEVCLAKVKAATIARVQQITDEEIARFQARD